MTPDKNERESKELDRLVAALKQSGKEEIPPELGVEIGDTLTFLGSWGTEGSADGEFEAPRDVAVAPGGDIYVADTDNTRWRQPEGPGLAAIAEGFRHLGYPDDHALNAAEWIVYDALYARLSTEMRSNSS